MLGWWRDLVRVRRASRLSKRASARRRAPKWKKSEGLLTFERWANDYVAWNARSS